MKAKIPTPKQKRSLRYYLTQLGYTAEYANVVVSQNIASGDWSFEMVKDVILPSLKDRVDVVKHISDEKNYTELLSRLSSDINQSALAIKQKDSQSQRQETIEALNNDSDKLPPDAANQEEKGG